MQITSVTVSMHQMDLNFEGEYFNPQVHAPDLTKKKHPEVKLVKRSSTGYADEEHVVKADMHIGDNSYTIEMPESLYKRLESKVKQKRYREANLFAAPYIRVIHKKP